MLNAAWDVAAVSDPTDWPEPWHLIRGLDSSLRCELCFDIFRAPVSLKECNHVFCSTCIRTHINQPQSAGAFCPKCRQKKAFDSELVPQHALEAASENWRQARSMLLKRAKDEQQAAESSRGTKRKVTPPRHSSSDNDVASHAANGEGLSRPTRVLPARASRNQKRPREASPGSVPGGDAFSGSPRNTHPGSSRYDAVVIDDDDAEDEDYVPGDTKMSSQLTRPQRSHGSDAEAEEEGAGPAGDYRSLQASDLVPCPICNHTFTNSALNQHLDKGCEPGGSEPSALERGLLPVAGSGNGAKPKLDSWFNRSKGGGGAASSSKKTAPSSPSGTSKFGKTPEESLPAPKKLVRPQYNLKSEREIKAMLQALSLPTTGNKERLVERHRQWVNLFNANLDASAEQQKTDRQLRRELTEWDRGQDESMRMKAKGGLVNEKKAKNWVSENREQYSQLVESARKSFMRDKELRKKQEPSQDSGLSAEGDADASAPSEGSKGERASCPTAMSPSGAEVGGEASSPPDNSQMRETDIQEPRDQMQQ